MENINEAIEIIISINSRLRNGKIFFDEFEGLNDSQLFFNNIKHFGFNSDDIIVMSITPDGNDTVIGRFMTKERELYFFDFDLFDLKYSEVRKVSPQNNPGKRGSLLNAEFFEEAAGNVLFDDRVSQR